MNSEMIIVYDPSIGDTRRRPAQQVCDPCADGQHFRFIECPRLIAPEPNDYLCKCEQCGPTAN